MEPALTIGMLSTQTGLLPKPRRTEGNQRRYEQAHVDRLRFILHARELGFNLIDTKELLALSEVKTAKKHDSSHAIAEQHLIEVKHRIKRLNALKRELESMLVDCEKSAPTRLSTVEKPCRVIEVLCDHRLCHEEHG